MARLTRLSIGDRMTFWAESRAAPMHIALAGVLEPPADVRIDDLRQELAVRTTRVPDFAQRVRWTRLGQGGPLLVDDVDHRAEDHIVVLDPVDLDDHAAYRALAARRALEWLDHERPLWRADLVPDTSSNRVGVVLVLHHALADGIRGIVLAATMFDGAPGAAVPAVRPPVQPPPTSAELVADNLAVARDAARYALGLLGRRPHGGEHRGWSDAKATLKQLGVRATRTRLDGPLGAQRDLRVVQRPLAQLRAIGHAHGATINDVLLTAVSGGMRDLLLAHGNPVDGLALRVSIPVASPPGARNAGGSMPIVTWLPVGDPDPRARLDAIHDDLVERKSGRDRSYTGVTGSPLMPAFVMHAITSFMRGRGGRMVNLYVTNVPGPSDPLWLGPAKLTQPVPIAPLVAGGRISIAALSYDGALAIAVHTDASLAHTDRLAEGIASTLDELAPAPVPVG